jgi:hypothetical protein
MEQFVGNKIDNTFKLRYIIDDQFYRANSSDDLKPILVYCGNEATAQ